MVVDLILNSAYQVILFILTPILSMSDVSLSSDISSAFTQARGFLHATDFIFPYTTLVAVLAAILIIEAAILAYKVIYWIIKKIPTIS